MLLHNFEIHRNGEIFEVDLAIIAPHAVYLVDVKGTHGLIDVYGPKWYPERRQPYSSPLLKLRGHARTLKGIITASQPGRRDLEGVYVDSAIVLAAPDAVFQDPGGRDAPNVTTLAKSVAFFENAARIPGKYSKNIRSCTAWCCKALQGVAKPRSGPLRFNSWEVTSGSAARTATPSTTASTVRGRQVRARAATCLRRRPVPPVDRTRAAADSDRECIQAP